MSLPEKKFIPSNPQYGSQQPYLKQLETKSPGFFFV